LRDALIDLGHTCSVKEDEVAIGSINIVIGAVVWRAKHRSLGFLKSAPYVLYQFEQLFTDKGITIDVPEYAVVLNAANQILEYSPSNVDYLNNMGLSNKTIYCPPSFHRSLEQFRPSLNPQIDVLLVGSRSERRQRIMDQLRAKGIVAVEAFGIYGDELINCMKNAKIVLNVHFADGINALETMRISYALANRCFAISEVGDHNPYGEGIVYSDYDSLVETCLDYLGPSADKRASIAAEGYLEYRRSDFVADLNRAIERMPITDLVSSERTDVAGGAMIS
jgi:hypothetical protein